MKNYFKISTLFLTLITLISLLGCNDDDSDNLVPIPPGEGSLNMPPLDPQLVKLGKTFSGMILLVIRHFGQMCFK